MNSTEVPKEEKLTDGWMPWGSIFPNNDFLKLPGMVYPVLDEAGFKSGGRDRVVITIMRLLRPGQTIVRFTFAGIAEQANVTRKTVYRVVGLMSDMGAKRIRNGSTDYYRRSEYDLAGFVQNLETFYRLVEIRKARDEKVMKQVVKEIEETA